MAEAPSTRDPTQEEWTGLLTKAHDAIDYPIVERTSKALFQSMREHGWPNGDKAVQYQQKQHSALERMFAHCAVRDDLSLSLIRHLMERIRDLEEAMTR